MVFIIMKLLLTYLGCWNGNRPRSSVQVLKIWKKARITEKIRLLMKSPVLKNLKKDDLNARIMRFRPSWKRDS